MSPDLRTTVRKRFMWLAAASLLALPAAGCEGLDSFGLDPGEAPTVAKQSYISGAGIGGHENGANPGVSGGGFAAGIASAGLATGQSGGASGAGSGGPGGNGGGAGH